MVRILFLMLISINFLQAQTKEEYQQYLEINLKNDTYIKSGYQTKTENFEIEFYVMLQGDQFIFRTYENHIGMFAKTNSRTLTEVSIDVKSLKWHKDFSSLQVKSPIDWLPEMKYNYVDLELKEGDLVNLKKYNLEKEVPELIREENYIIGNSVSKTEKDQNGESFTYQVEINSTEFYFLTQNENSESSRKSAEALTWMFKLARLSGAEEF